MVQHPPQRALSFPTLPGARALRELQNVLFSGFSRKVLDEPRCGFCRNRLIDVNLKNKHMNKRRGRGSLVFGL